MRSGRRSRRRGTRTGSTTRQDARATRPGSSRRHPPQQADRRLTIRREDPVLVCQGMHRSCLNGFVPPEDGVGADPPLPVIDDRALVVGPERHHAPVDREQVGLGEPRHHAVCQVSTVSDDPADVGLRRHHLGHGALVPETRTLNALRSASKVTLVTSPRSSPSTWRGVGPSQSISTRSRSWR